MPFRRWMTGRGWIIVLLCLALVLLYGPGTVSWADDNDHDDTRDNTTDFAFFDGTNPAGAPPNGGAECTVKGPSTLHASVTAHSSGPAGFVRLTYEDNDFVQFPIASNGTLQLTQAIGGTPDVSRRVRLSNGGDAAGARLVGSLSVIGRKGPSCISCAVDDGAGAPGCVNNP